MANTWKSYPKVELHLHLDCSIGYDAARRLRPGMTLAEFEREFVAPPRCKDLAEFLSCVAPSVSLMQTETALRLSVESLFRQLADDGVVYAEIRFAPMLHLERLSPESVVETVLTAVKEQESKHDIKAGVILCTLRHFDETKSLQTANLVKRYARDGVVAIDLAADESAYSVDSHVRAFHLVQEAGLHTTAHAGEARGADSVWETLNWLRPERIGHGVRSIEDELLVDHLARANIHLEICPTCNIQIRVFDSLPSHPIDRFIERGVSVGINTDARTVVGTTLSEDYHRLEQTMGWKRADFDQANAHAAEASFASDPDKEWTWRRLGLVGYIEPDLPGSASDTQWSPQ